LKRLFLLLIPNLLFASSPTTWEMSSFTEFVRGRFDNVALSRGGQLSVSQRFDPIFSGTEPFIWSVAQTPAGDIYAGTGNRGQLYRIDPGGKSSLIWTAPQPEIFAIVADAKGVVYAGTSPDGKIYRIENGKATEYFDPKSPYIWALALAPDGALYAGTGNNGTVFRITAANTGEAYYATGQANVTGLAFDREGRLLAGTEPNGILYRITAKDKAFVLYDANLPEIRAIASDPDGSIYAVALGGSVAHKSQNAATGGASSPVTGTPSVTTSITVTAEAAQAGDMKPPAAPELPKAQPAPAAQSQTSSTTVDLTGVERSAIYKIHPDHTVETLWSSKEENVYDLLALNGELIFGTDVNGRIYRFSADRKLSLIEQTNDAEITRMFRAGNSVLAATGNKGAIYRLGDSPAAKGSYESPDSSGPHLE
jgi:sugar lactone lactonase YvrE